MIAFDTNHLLRHILQDDPKQCSRVSSLIKHEAAKGEQIRLFDLVLMETGWVLQSAYGFDRAAWAEILEDLLSDPVFSFDDSSRLWDTLERYRKGKADFSDHLIASHAASIGASLETFDKKLKKEL